MKRYSREWKIKKGLWVQPDISNSDKVWRIHYIENETEYSTGSYFTRKEAEDELRRIK